ncbi:MAG TPA: hypothetical protein VFG30_04965 [Polyangiales bacterium]|nr:hypothetical protein [Polyangiales bacterium]
MSKPRPRRVQRRSAVLALVGGVLAAVLTEVWGRLRGQRAIAQERAPAQAGAATDTNSAVRALESGRPEFTLEKRKELVYFFDGEIIEELELPNEEKEALILVLVSQQSGLANPERAMNPRPKWQDEAEIAETIGTGKAGRFMQLRRMQPAFATLKDLRRDLESPGAPMSEAQYRDLRALMMRDGNMESPVYESYSRDDYFRAHTAWLMDFRRRLHVRRAEILTPLQLRVLEEEDDLCKTFEKARTEGTQPHLVLSDANNRAYARRGYGSLVAQLNLPERELDALLAVLGAQSYRDVFRLGPRTDTSSEIEAVIGPEKTAEFEALKQSRTIRNRKMFGPQVGR